MAMNSNTTSPKYCGSCGKELLSGADFCAYCGAPVPKLGPQSLHQIPTSPYYVTSRPTLSPTEPPFPFLKHFQGVILTPQREMPIITGRPNIKQPLILNLVIGILAGAAIAVFLSKASMTFYPEFYQSLEQMGLPLTSSFDFESYILFSFFIGSLIGPLIFWLLNSGILYLILVVMAPNTPSPPRNFRTTATIAGWASVPQIVGETFNIFYNLIFVPETSFEFSDFEDIQNIALPVVSGPIEWVSLALDAGLLIWGVLLVYWALKSIFPQGNQPVVIAVGYIVARIAISVLLSGFIL
ncbi:MAG: YIP1 family protein [Candidatus Thorarchaeota archaeon]